MRLSRKKRSAQRCGLSLVPDNSHQQHEPSCSEMHPKTTTAAHDPFVLLKSPTHCTSPPPRTAGATPLFWLPSLSATSLVRRTQLLIQQSTKPAETKSKSSCTRPASLHAIPSTQFQPREVCPARLHTSWPDQSPLPTTRTLTIPEVEKGECNPRKNRSGVKHATVARSRPEIAVEHK